MGEDLVRATDEEKATLIATLGAIPTFDLSPGASTRIVQAQNMTLSFARLEPGVRGVPHSHEHEQVIVGLDGWHDMLVDGKTYRINPGDVIVIPGGVPHAGISGDSECNTVEIFAPARKDLEERLARARAGKTDDPLYAAGAPAGAAADYPRATEEERAAMVTRVVDVPPVELRPGSVTRIVPARNMTLSFLHLSAGLDAKPHSHPHEQVVVLLKGEMELALGGKLYRVNAGEVGVLPGGVPHSGVTRDVACDVLDVFSPARKDFEEKLAAAREQAG
jgi:quercetin dioxygenase-like cupin family protein